MLDPEETLQAIRQTLWDKVGIVRNEEQLQKAYKQLLAIEESIKQQGLTTHKEKGTNLISKMKVYNVLTLALMTTKGALIRKESRAAHYREDYPTPDPDFQKNILFVNDKTYSVYPNFRIELCDCTMPSKRIIKGLEQHDEKKRLANYTHHE